MASSKETKDRRANGIAAGLGVLALVLICGAVLWNFIGAFFIAVVGYVFLNPLYTLLRERGLGKVAAGWATLVVGAIVLGAPAFLALSLILQQTLLLLNSSTLQQSIVSLSSNLSNIDAYLPAGMQMDTGRLSAELTSAFLQAAGYVKNVLLGWLEGIGSMALGLLIVVFTFYYLLTAEGSLASVREVLPFSKRNTDILIRDFRSVLYSSIVVTGIMALVQAVPLTLVFMYFNVPGAVFLGFLAAILTCVPFTGIPFVWIPVAALELLGGNYPAGLGIIAAGIVIAAIENFRPMLQNRIGDIHPLVALLGVIVGVVYFGILGLFIGPILLSFTLLCARMFKEEYL
ncbi:MAG: AI-2E family transporter [Candidatus Micrarchaeia archaeon]